MNVLILGANGYMGPHVIQELAGRHTLRITDIRPAPAEIQAQYGDHQFMDVDITSWEQVRRAAEGMDAIVNLSVVRNDRVLAFQVNTFGCWHVMRAAAEHGIRRVINTGPHFTVAGPSYENWDHAIVPDVPPHPGTELYPLTKSLGQEICRVYSQAHDIYVQTYLFYSLRDAQPIGAGKRRGALRRFVEGCGACLSARTGDRPVTPAHPMRSVFHPERSSPAQVSQR